MTLVLEFPTEWAEDLASGNKTVTHQFYDTINVGDETTAMSGDVHRKIKIVDKVWVPRKDMSEETIADIERTAPSNFNGAFRMTFEYIDKKERVSRIAARYLRALDEEVLEELAEARSISEDVLNDPKKLADRFLDYAAEIVQISGEAETPEEAAIAAVFHLLVGIDGEAGMPYFPPCQLIPNGSDIDISGKLHHDIQQKVKSLSD